MLLLCVESLFRAGILMFNTGHPPVYTGKRSHPWVLIKKNPEIISGFFYAIMPIDLYWINFSGTHRVQTDIPDTIWLIDL